MHVDIVSHMSLVSAATLESRVTALLSAETATRTQHTHDVRMYAQQMEALHAQQHVLQEQLEEEMREREVCEHAGMACRRCHVTADAASMDGCDGHSHAHPLTCAQSLQSHIASLTHHTITYEQHVASIHRDMLKRVREREKHTWSMGKMRCEAVKQVSDMMGVSV